MSLDGKTVVFTGKLATMSRAEAQVAAEKAGAKVTKAVSGKTDILVNGGNDGDTSKSIIGSAKGIEVWTEQQFLDAIAGKKAAPAKKTPAKKAKADDDAADAEEEPPKKAAKTETKPTPAAAAAAAAPAATGGARPVDREVPGRDTYKVFEDYAVTLNQTNIEGNNNKFYIIQILQDKDGAFYAWNRWGRVGEPGQNKLEKVGSLAAAKKSFCDKFKDKAANAWDDRHNFKPKAGKYTLVETEEKEGGAEDDSSPIGKLSKAQIEKGQAVLEELTAAIEGKKSSSVLSQLSSQFFTLIPTNFGRTRPTPITTIDKVREKEELLKFYLRMGFEEMDDTETKLTPISGVMELPVPATLHEAAISCTNSGSIASSVKQGDVLAKKQAGSPVRPMDKEKYGSIMLYTSNAIYRDLNKVLRDEKRAGVKKYFNYLRLLFDACDSLPKKNVTLWRGISVDLSQQYKEGTTVTWWGVSSCTSDQQVARNFMNGCGGDCSFLTIDTKTAVDISQITFYSNEKESLLLPGTQLLVKKVTKKGKVAEIHLEEVGRLVA